jgi:hypothetical protein
MQAYECSDNFSQCILHLTREISVAMGPCHVALIYGADVLICDVTQKYKGTIGETKLHNEKLSDLYSSSNCLLLGVQIKEDEKVLEASNTYRNMTR